LFSLSCSCSCSCSCSYGEERRGEEQGRSKPFLFSLSCSCSCSYGEERREEEQGRSKPFSPFSLWERAERRGKAKKGFFKEQERRKPLLSCSYGKERESKQKRTEELGCSSLWEEKPLLPISPTRSK
jgi:hypothetical protein